MREEEGGNQENEYFREELVQQLLSILNRKPKKDNKIWSEKIAIT